MSSTRNTKWVLVETKHGKRMVRVKSLKSAEEQKAADAVTDNDSRENPKPGNNSGDSPELMKSLEKENPVDCNDPKDNSDPDVKEEEGKDYSSSGSSWAPDEVGASSDSDESPVDEKNSKPSINFKVKQYKNKRTGKKVMMPTHRPTPIIPNVLQPKNVDNNVNIFKIPQVMNKKYSLNKTLPVGGVTKKHSARMSNIWSRKAERRLIYQKEIAEIKKCFEDLFQIATNLQAFTSQGVDNKIIDDTAVIHDLTTENTINEKNEDTKEINDMMSDPNDSGNRSDYSNRSDDNVLITNKYDHVKIQTESTNNQNEEWIPIGSGKTLLHIDKYRQVNWKTYTIATRTLLLALFPRRVLATHSLTGKKSPAFMHKPAKMCLDPKIVSDVIIEITDRFKVRESFVRNIITTKCADECKMFKMRTKLKQKNKSAGATDDKENAQQENNDNDD